MALWGEVSLKVKRAIVLLESFTTGQIADMTGLEYQSVETAVQRLLRDGYIIHAKPRRGEEPRRVGRPRQVYAIADDPEIKRELNSSIEAFQIGEALEAAPDRKPDTAHYHAAISILDTLESGKKDTTPVRLNRASDLLAFARRHEEMVEEGLEVANAYIDFQQARLESLQSNWAESERLLTQARMVFEDFDLKNEVRLVDEYFLAIKLKQELAVLLQDTDPNTDLLARRFRGVLKSLSHLAVSPVVSSFVLQVGDIVDVMNRSKAELVDENKKLKMKIDQLVADSDESVRKPQYGVVHIASHGAPVSVVSSQLRQKSQVLRVDQAEESEGLAATPQVKRHSPFWRPSASWFVPMLYLDACESAQPESSFWQDPWLCEMRTRLRRSEFLVVYYHVLSLQPQAPIEVTGSRERYLDMLSLPPLTNLIRLWLLSDLDEVSGHLIELLSQELMSRATRSSTDPTMYRLALRLCECLREPLSKLDPRAWHHLSEPTERVRGEASHAYSGAAQEFQNQLEYVLHTR